MSRYTAPGDQRRVAIYGLTDCDGRIFYVGQSVDADQRLAAHLREVTIGTHRDHPKADAIRGWLSAVPANGRDESQRELWATDELTASIKAGSCNGYMRLLDLVDFDQGCRREAEWTAYLFRQGAQLANQRIEFKGGLREVVDWTPDEATAAFLPVGSAS